MAQRVPDVRVRLSAEGVADVVRAFQQVSAAAQNSGKGSRGVRLLNSALADLKTLLPAIGIGAAVAGLAALSKQALHTADSMGKLSAKTGITVETLSVLTFAGETADATFEQLSGALIKFNKNMADLDEGGRQAGGAVRDLLGSSEALNGLNTEQRFFKIVDAIGAMESGYKKTKAAQDFFGKSGAALIPLFNDLANDGFEEARRKAQAFGLVFDQDLADAAQRANDNLKIVGLQVRGLATQFVTGLAPAIATAAATLTKATTGGGVSGIQVLGDAIGVLTKLVVLLFTTVGGGIGALLGVGQVAVEDFVDVVKTAWQDLKTISSAAIDALKAAASGQLNVAAGIIGGATAIVIENDKKLVDRMAERLKLQGRILAAFGQDVAKTFKDLDFLEFLNSGEGDGPGAPGSDGGTTPLRDAIKARADLLRAQVQNELAIAQAGFRLAEEQQKRLYDQGLISLEQYYDARARIIRDAADAEIAALEREREQLAATPLDIREDETDDSITAKEIKRQQDLAALDTRIAVARLERQGKLDDLAQQRWDAELAFMRMRQDAERQLLEGQGNTYQAALDAIDQEAEELKRLRLPPELIQQLIDLRRAKADIAELERQGGNALAELSNIQATIDNEQAAGALFPFEAVQKYNAAVQAALPNLERIAEKRLAAAATEEEVAAAEAFANQVRNLAVSTDMAAVRMAAFKSAVEQSLTSNLTNFFASGIDEARNFGEAIASMARSVVDSLRQIAAQMLATLIVQRLLSAAGGIPGFSTGGQVAQAGVAAAEGGFITGPGTGTSDSIPARLSAGEFVVRASAVAQPGVLPLLAAINRGMGPPTISRGGIPRFATGGLVDAGLGGGGMGELYVGLEEGIIVKRVEGFMRSKLGQEVQISTLKQNPKAARTALGR